MPIRICILYSNTKIQTKANKEAENGWIKLTILSHKLRSALSLNKAVQTRTWL